MPKSLYTLHIEFLGKKFEKRRTYFNNMMRHLFQRAEQIAGKEGYYSKKILDLPIRFFIFGGFKMEISSEMTKKINEEMEISNKLLQKTYNDLKTTYSMLEPEMYGLIKTIRQTRMTISTELKTSLTIMKDVRKFFLESDYEKEMERLERFVSLGERMKILINDGTLDAICDVSLKLAIGNE
jgi:hypothetical protein